MPKQSPTQREDRERNLLDAAYRLFISKGEIKEWKQEKTTC